MVGHSRMLNRISQHPLIVVLTGLCVALLLVSTLSAVHASFQPSLVALPNSAAPQVVGAHVLGNHNATDRMTIGLLLQTRNQQQQQQLLKSLYSPKSALYRHWLKSGEFAARFAPSAAQVTAAESFLTAAGLQLVATSPSPILILASGTTNQIETAFHTHIEDYSTPRGTTFFANSSNALLPRYLSGNVVGVLGLTNAVAAHSYAGGANIQPHASAVPPYGGGPFGSGLTPSQIAGIYNATPVYSQLHTQGQGTTLAVFELSGYTHHDIDAYEDHYQLPDVPLVDKLVLGGAVAVTPGGSPDYGAAEVELDIELQIAMAPGAKSILVYQSPNSEIGVVAQYLQIAKDNQADAISSSWGNCEYLSTSSQKLGEFQAFTQMAMQGQSIFAASGDNGAFDCLPYSDANLTGNNQSQVDDPAGQPYVTAVGGTSFQGPDNVTTFDPGSNLHPTYPGASTELTWTDGCPPKDCAGGASGGGVSRYWGSPDYQSGGGQAVPGFIQPGLTQSGAYCNQSAGVFCREVPDVSMDADPSTGYSIYCTDKGDSFCATGEFGSPGWIRLGGTSCAAPLWAGITALIDAYTKGRAGLLNYYVYNFDSSTGYASQFHDITKFDNGRYPAAPAYDMATGVGSPNIYHLVKP